MDQKWQEILDRPDFLGYEFKEAPSPSTTSDTIIRCRTLCAENKCGCYGTTWACPPHSCSEEKVLEILSRYPNAIIVHRVYEADWHDMEQCARISAEFQNMCRNISLAAKAEGLDNIPLGDGGCMYCKKCAMPEPCRYPDRMVMSISGMGIDLSEYLGLQGIDFSFEDGKISLYGLILY